MKISEQRLNEARRQHTEAIVARHMDELFRRLPRGHPPGNSRLAAVTTRFQLTRSEGAFETVYSHTRVILPV